MDDHRDDEIIRDMPGKRRKRSPSIGRFGADGLPYTASTRQTRAGQKTSIASSRRQSAASRRKSVQSGSQRKRTGGSNRNPARESSRRVNGEAGASKGLDFQAIWRDKSIRLKILAVSGLFVTFILLLIVMVLGQKKPADSSSGFSPSIIGRSDPDSIEDFKPPTGMQACLSMADTLEKSGLYKRSAVCLARYADIMQKKGDESTDPGTRKTCYDSALTYFDKAVQCAEKSSNGGQLADAISVRSQALNRLIYQTRFKHTKLNYRDLSDH